MQKILFLVLMTIASSVYAADDKERAPIWCVQFQGANPVYFDKKPSQDHRDTLRLHIGAIVSVKQALRSDSIVVFSVGDSSKHFEH